MELALRKLLVPAGTRLRVPLGVSTCVEDGASQAFVPLNIEPQKSVMTPVS